MKKLLTVAAYYQRPNFLITFVTVYDIGVTRCAFQGNCHSQCQELRQELIKDCRNDLGPNSEQCRADQKRFQEICHDESLEE